MCYFNIIPIYSLYSELQKGEKNELKKWKVKKWIKEKKETEKKDWAEYKDLSDH